MLSRYSDANISHSILTLESIEETIDQIIHWNKSIVVEDDFLTSQNGMQLLAANCMLITAIGEGINRIGKSLPHFLDVYFPTVPWKQIVGMRNHIAHGYFEIDSAVVFEAVKSDVPSLKDVISEALNILRNYQHDHHSD